MVSIEVAEIQYPSGRIQATMLMNDTVSWKSRVSRSIGRSIGALSSPSFGWYILDNCLETIIYL